MCTIAAGQVAGMSRAAALEFSFFLSIPTMFVATGYDLLKTIRPHAAAEAIAPSRDDAASLACARDWFCGRFHFAFAVVAWFLRWVRRHGFTPFAIYRIVLGLSSFSPSSRGLLGR